MGEKIFGYEWHEIQEMQRKGGKRPSNPIDLTKPGGPSPPKSSDIALLEEHGIDYLREHMYGVAERILHAGLA